MEREFGEKSFKPAPFEFATLFSGNFNREYHNLFSRKLPGQILMSVYYTPMTTRELAIELGVASVYLEDEIAMLEKYNFISKTPAGKYQTNLLIFTDDFTNEFYKKAEKFVASVLAEIITSVKGKLEQVRNLNRFCEALSENRLLWSLLWVVMCQGHKKIKQEYSELQEKDTLYDGATGINYGISNDKADEEFGCDAFAGYSKIDENYYASAADFSVLPEKNWYFEKEDHTVLADAGIKWKEKIYKTVSGEIQPEFMILTEAEESKLFGILSEEVVMMAKLYQQLFSCACQIMHIHAPKSVREQIERIVFQTLFFRTAGFIGGCAVKHGVLVIPDFDGAAAMYIRENSKIAEAAVNQDVLV